MMTQGYRGGFKAEREFGFFLAQRFPGLELAEEVDGVVLVVEVDNPRRLNAGQLSKVLVGAAKGGITTAVIQYQGRAVLAEIVSVFDLFLLAEEAADLRQQQRLEAAVRTAA